METKSGLRATPAPFVIAFGTMLSWAVIRFVMSMTLAPNQQYTPKMILIGEGIGLATQILIAVGALELAQRFTGLARGYVRLAAWAIIVMVFLDTCFGLLQFMKDQPMWVYKAWDYTSIVCWNVFAFGLVQALGPKHRTLGYVALGVVFVAWLPPLLREPLYEMLKIEGKTGLIVFTILRVLRYLALGWLAIAASSYAVAATPASPTLAGSGFRLAAKGLWIRVITAVVVVMFTLMLIVGKGGQGSMSFFKLVLMSQAIVSMIALLCIGLGGLRAARAGLPELNPFALGLGSAAALWATGVALAQLPHLYKMLYGSEYMSRNDESGMTTALTLAAPIVVILGVGLFATALSGYAARRGDEALRSDAQSKGFGFVLLMLVAIAVQNWMLPKASSTGGFLMYSLLAAVASLWATVMVAKLFGRGADMLESEPGLPTASVVSDS